ncbi:MAG: ribose 5-phosphate isomerase A [Candidatus Diapherotrites archaeon]|nr:ribose 5-phosphate isomerase A [Candidatus Diapherotrites archaeon]
MIPLDMIEALLEKYVKQNYVVSLGTGASNEAFLKKLAIYVENSSLRIRIVPTSHSISLLCSQLKVPTVSLDDAEIDLAFDFVDQVDEDFNYISNETTSLIRDKMIAQDAAEMIVICHEKSFVKRFNCPISAEISSFAPNKTLTRLMNLGEVTLRAQKGKPIMSETGHYFADIKVDEIYSLEDIDYQAKAIPGVLETSLFIGYADRIVLYGNNLTVKSRLTNTEGQNQ